jgi:hypothetical protein
VRLIDLGGTIKFRENWGLAQKPLLDVTVVIQPLQPGQVTTRTIRSRCPNNPPLGRADVLTLIRRRFRSRFEP